MSEENEGSNRKVMGSAACQCERRMTPACVYSRMCSSGAVAGVQPPLEEGLQSLLEEGVQRLADGVHNEANLPAGKRAVSWLSAVRSLWPRACAS